MNYKDSKAWQHALSVCEDVYHATKRFPESQRFSLSNQMQRASVSIMSNIAEGWHRTKAEWHRFLRIAYGSSTELESHLILSKKLGFLDPNAFERIMFKLDQIQRMLNYYTQKR